MKVILKEDVKKLGQRGEIVNVADGYGRNYLIPRGLAEEATEGTLNELKHKKRVRAKKESERLAEAKEIAEELAKEKFTVKVKAGENGRLFGSVTTMDIADKAKKAGYEIDKRKILLDDHIKALGIYDVKIKIHEDVTATVKVEVVEA